MGRGALYALTVALLFHLAFLCAQVEAAVFSVDLFSDGPQQACNDSSPGDCTLRGAIDAASSNGESDVIEVPPGMYTIGSEIVIDLKDGGSVEINAFGAELRPLTARAVRISAGHVVVRGMAITGGRAPDGGGILVEAGEVHLDRVKLEGNAATQSGGGAFVASAAVLSAFGLQVTSNSADDSGGGIESRGELRLRTSNIRENEAGNGGGIHFAGGAGELFAVSIIGNRAAQRAGGLEISAGGEVSLSGSEIADNVAGDSGAIGMTDTTSTLEVIDSTIARNASGFCNLILLNTVIRRSAILANRLSQAPGPGNICSVGELNIENSTVSGNDEPALRAASQSVIRLESSTIVDASSPFSSPITARNSIIAACAAGPTYVSLGHNVLDDGCQVVGIGLGNRIVGNPAELGLQPLSGGVHPLMPTSPAVDSGDPGCLATDQRGLLRPADGDGDGSAQCDSGSFELAAEAAITPINIPALDFAGTLALMVLLIVVSMRRIAHHACG